MIGQTISHYRIVESWADGVREAKAQDIPALYFNVELATTYMLPANFALSGERA
jgi:hypothetical protein